MKLLQIEKKMLFTFFVAFFLLHATYTHAYIAGADAPIKSIETPNRDICLIFPQYIVISVAEGAEVGNMIVVRKRAGDKDLNCGVPEKGNEWLTINGIESTETFYGLYHHLLFTDDGGCQSLPSNDFIGGEGDERERRILHPPLIPSHQGRGSVVEPNSRTFRFDFILIPC